MFVYCPSLLPIIAEAALGGLSGAPGGALLAAGAAGESMAMGAARGAASVANANAARLAPAAAGLIGAGAMITAGVVSNTVGEPSAPQGEEQRNVTGTGVFMNETKDVQVGTVPGLNSLVPTTDSDIMHFLAQPVQIHQFTWDIGGSVAAFDPWTLWAAQATIKRKLSNLFQISGKLKLDIITNGNAYQYGKLIFGYLPAPASDPYRSQTLGLTGYAVTNLPLQFSINPSSDTVIQVELPWSKQVPARLDGGFFAADMYNIGAYQPYVAAPLGTTSTGLLNPYVDVTIFASMTDVKLSYQTSIIPASDYKGVLSKPLLTLASLASNISQVPIIGKYATAASTAAKGSAELATLFGFSAPNNIVPMSVQQVRKTGQVTQTIVQDSSIVLATDPRAQTYIDPSILSLSSEDEMAYAHRNSKYSLVCRDTWDDTQAIGSAVFTSKSITPFLTDQTFPYAPSHVAYDTMVHDAYRGSLLLRIEIPSNPFCTGRLQFTFEPANAALVGTGFNTNLSVIYDLATHKELVISIPYTLREYFAKNATYVGNSGLQTANSYGLLSCKVISALRAGGVSVSLKVLTSIAAGPDYELTIPSYDQLRSATQFIGFFPAATPASPPADSKFSYYPWTTISLVAEPGDDVEIFPSSLDVANSESVVQIGSGEAPKHEFAILYASEKFVSWRNLVKRWNFHRQFLVYTKSGFGGRYIPQFIFPPGYVQNLAGTIYDNTTIGWTHLAWLAPTYLGRRGAMRHLFKVLQDEDNIPTRSGAIRTTLNGTFNNFTNGFSPVIYQGMTQGSDFVSEDEDLRIHNPHVFRYNYQLNSEVDPYRASNQGGFLLQACTNTSAAVVATKTYSQFIAAGDDFTYYFYKGPPVLFNITIG